MSEKINSLEKDNDDSKCDEKEKSKAEQRNQWFHPHGDVLAALVAVGANSFAGRGARGASELNASKRFCEENGLSSVVMQRIQKLRKQLAKLVKLRMPCAKGTAARTGGVMYNMPPPNRLQENILSQVCMPKLYYRISVAITHSFLICFEFFFAPFFCLSRFYPVF